MRRMAVGLAAASTLGLAGSAFGESDFDEIQDEEQPGSEIGIQIGGGTVSAQSSPRAFIETGKAA